MGVPFLEQLLLASTHAPDDVMAVSEDTENVLSVQSAGKVGVTVVAPFSTSAVAIMRNSSQMKELTQVARRSSGGSGVASSGGVWWLNSEKQSSLRL